MVTISYFTLSFAVTLWMSRFLLKYVDQTHFLDHPVGRKIHDKPTPRFGGFAFGAAIIIVGWFLLNDLNQYTWYFLGAIGIFILGAVDDYWGLTWRYKLPVQLFIGVLVSLQFITEIGSVSFYGITLTSNLWVMIGLFVFWFIGILNAMNLIDGMDGLAGGYMTLIAFSSMVIGWVSGATDFVLLNGLVVGAMLAFLIFNQRPAKYFMGDCGSLLLGYHVAVMPLFFLNASSGKSSQIEITPFLILATYIIIDTVRVFFTRLRRGQHPLTPDNSHLHHQLLNESRSRGGTLIVILLISSITGAISVISTIVELSSIWAIGYLIVVAVFSFLPRSNTLFVKLTGSIIRTFNKKKHSLSNKTIIIPNRILPIFILIYFMGLLLLAGENIFVQSGVPLLISSAIAISLYMLQSSKTSQRHEVMLVVIGIIQTLLLSSQLIISDPVITMQILLIVGKILRYFAMTIIVVIAFLNYIVNSHNLTGEFWSTTDLLVLFLLIGLSSIQVLGLGIPTVMSFELGMIYFANKLYIPKTFKMDELAVESGK